MIYLAENLKKYRVMKNLTQEEVAEYVVNNAKAGDLVLTMGCGDIYKSAFMMIERLKNGTV